MTLRIVAIADTDSYVKWSAALLGALGPTSGPPAWDASLIVLDTPLVVSTAQERAALAGSGLDESAVRRSTWGDLGARLRELAPDAVVLAARGPLVRVLARAVAELEPRPVIVSGLPGISIPTTRKALFYRAQTDLMVLHSHREVREFAALAAAKGFDQRFGLATLPFAAHARAGSSADPDAAPGATDLVFAAQAKVPAAVPDRQRVARLLVDAARADPSKRVVVKLRGLAGEAQTHAELAAYPDLIAGLGEIPANLVFSTEPMARALDSAEGLLTISSTALIEAVARGIPAIALDTFGVSNRLINEVFAQSGLLAGEADVLARRFRHPSPSWLNENYFHDSTDADWDAAARALVELRRRGDLPPKAPRPGAGGGLRAAWERKTALGRADRSLSGAFALAVGVPARGVVRTMTRARRAFGSSSSG